MLVIVNFLKVRFDADYSTVPTMPSAPSTMAPSGLNSLPPVVSGAPVFPTPTTTIAPGPRKFRIQFVACPSYLCPKKLTFVSLKCTSLATPGGSTVLQVTNFEISYTIDQQQIPTTTDYDGLTSATSSYLQSAFQQYFLSFPAVLFSSSLTLRTNQVFNLNQPVIVDFNTTVTFSPGSQQPAVSELDGVVNTAFTTNNANYLAVLTGLQGNIFSTTTVATFSPLVLSSEKSSTTTAAAAKTAGIAVAAGAGAFIVLVGAIMVHRRRGDSTQDDETLRKFNEDGHMTVAGDTFVGTLSLDSGRHADDDGGAPSNEWEGFAKYSTAKYRTNSPTSGNESDGTDGSDGLDGTNSEKPRRTLETVDL